MSKTVPDAFPGVTPDTARFQNYPRPPQQRSFSSSGDERNYLGELLEHFKSRNQKHPKRIDKYLDRFEHLLKLTGSDDGSILLQAHWALLHEFRGNIRQAIFHREREIKYVTRLLTKYGPVKTSIPIYSIDKAYLANAMRHLHAHYISEGELKKAARLLGKLREVRLLKRKQPALTRNRISKPRSSDKK